MSEPNISTPFNLLKEHKQKKILFHIVNVYDYIYLLRFGIFVGNFYANSETLFWHSHNSGVMRT